MHSIGSSITLKKLSQLCGFSVSTVSKALNDGFDISENTRNAIKILAKQYNYVPNSYAASLRKKQTSNVAVILPQVNTEFYSCSLYHIEKIANSCGYRVVLFQSFEERDREEEFLRNSNDGSIDGVIILSKNIHNKNTYNNLPIQYIQVAVNQPKKIVKENCIKGFNTLLKSIN